MPAHIRARPGPVVIREGRRLIDISPGADGGSKGYRTVKEPPGEVPELAKGTKGGLRACT
jgi:hypothetical protein